MSRYHSYLNTARTILQQYNGEEPCLSGRQAFASFLKKFFSLQKKYGSKDRKMISHLCYCFFRLGKMKNTLPAEERILAGLFLCSDQPNEILANLKPGWNEKAGLGLKEKFSILNPDSDGDQFSIPYVFPWKDELSEGIDHEKLGESFFIQPNLFLRLRPGNESIVMKKLEDAATTFEIISDSCLALPNSSKVDTIIGLNKEAVVQDYNSQRTGDLLKPGIVNLQPGISAWDCCAASGGKSIMLYDLYPHIDLTVSDARETILINLKKRFSEAGIAKYKRFVADLTSSKFKIQNSKFEIVLCDIPCTGSGTWGRTPEQLYYFDEEKINEYASLQKKILANIIPYLKPGGYLLYITCSVFKKENEEAIEFARQTGNLQLIKTEVLKGYDKKADTMFAALLRKPL